MKRAAGKERAAPRRSASKVRGGGAFAESDIRCACRSRRWRRHNRQRHNHHHCRTRHCPAMSLRNERFHERVAAQDDTRSPSERDRDRVLYSTYFRRLAGASHQVVHAGEGHVFHNRMTHSIKVAQVARRLAEYILRTCDPSEIEAAGGLDPNVVETAGLCYTTSAILSLWSRRRRRVAGPDSRTPRFPDGFEGNAQSISNRHETRVARSRVPRPQPHRRESLRDPKVPMGALPEGADEGAQKVRRLL